MKLEIEITRQDYADFNIFYFLRKRLARSLIMGIAGLISVEYLLNRDKTELNIRSIAVSSIVFVSLYGFIIYRSLTKTKNLPKEDGSILGKKEMEFTDEGINCGAKDSASQIKWTAIKSLDEDKNAFYLFMDANMGMIIPKRSFRNESEQQECKEFIQQRLVTA